MMMQAMDLSPVVVDAGLKGLALTALAVLAVVAMRRAGAAARHTVCLLVLVGLFVVPIASLVLPSWQVLPMWMAASPDRAADHLTADPGDGMAPPTAPAAPQVADAERGQGLTSAAADDAVSAMPAVSVAAATPPDKAVPAIEASSPEKAAHDAVAGEKEVDTPTQALPLRTLVGLIGPLWVGGLIIALVPLALGVVSLWLLKRRTRPITDGPRVDLFVRLKRELGISRRVDLVQSEARTVPMTWGLRRGTLVLPAHAAGWSPDRLRAVLLHELAHLKRRDPLTQIVGRLACALHWFNPLAWLLLRRMVAEHERACDDMVLAAGSGGAEYAGHLVSVVASTTGRRLSDAVAIAMARRSGLTGRVAAILDQRRNRRPPTRTALAATLLVALGIILPLAMMRARAAGPGDPDGKVVAEKAAAQDVAAPNAEPVARFMVLQPNGAPLVGTEIEVKRYVGLKSDYRLPHKGRTKPVTDERGAFSVPVGPGGTWQINIRVRGMGCLMTERFNVAPGETTDRTLKLKAGATVSGRVTDAKTGQPIEGAWTNFYSQDDDRNPFGPDVSKTDADGRWTATGLADGGWEVGINATGYQWQGAHRITVKDGRSIGGLEVALKPGASFDLLVLKPDGTPLANTKIGLNLWRATPHEPGLGSQSSSGRRTTDDEGRITVTGQRFNMKYHARLVLRDVGYGISEVAEVRPGQEPPTVKLRLIKGMRLSGTLVDSKTGGPIPGAYVHVRRKRHTDLHMPLGSAKTDEQGRWVRSSLPPGLYKVNPSKDGYTGEETEMAIVEGQEQGSIRLEMTPYADVRGIVLLPDGKTPVAGAAVSYHRKLVRTDAEGRFVVRMPEFGGRVTVAFEGFAAHTHTVRGGIDGRTPEQRIVLTTRGTTVSGTVVDGDTGRPVAGQEVYVVPCGEGTWLSRELDSGGLHRSGFGSFKAFGGMHEGARATTDAFGEFTAETVKPGTYAALIFPDKGVAQFNGPFKVVEGEPVTDVTLTITDWPIGFIVLRVLRPDGTPLSGSRLAVSFAPPGKQGGFTMSQLARGRPGYFKFTKTGSAQLVVAATGYAMVTRTVNVSELNVCLGVTVRLESQKADAVISGQVFMPDGTTPAREVKVTPYVTGRIWPESGNGASFGGNRYKFLTDRQATTDGEGRFRITGLRPGQYGVHASPVKELWEYDTPLRPDLAGYLPGMSAKQVEVAESGKADGLSVVLGRGGSIEGRCVDKKTGQPVAGVRVDPDWDHRGGLFGGQINPPMPTFRISDVKTNADGRFRFGNVPPGKYQVAFWPENNDYKHHRLEGWKAVKVTAGKTVKRTVKLEPRGAPRAAPRPM